MRNRVGLLQTWSAFSCWTHHFTVEKYSWEIQFRSTSRNTVEKYISEIVLAYYRHGQYFGDTTATAPSLQCTGNDRGITCIGSRGLTQMWIVLLSPFGRPRFKSLPSSSWLPVVPTRLSISLTSIDFQFHAFSTQVYTYM